jgi:predicted anti-sigma-YlaC factor YlaD
VRTEDEELSCSACFALLPLYVDLDVAGRAPELRLPGFPRHLEQCAACREEYETVRELARLETEDLKASTGG